MIDTYFFAELVFLRIGSFILECVMIDTFFCQTNIMYFCGFIFRMCGDWYLLLPD